VGDRLAGRWAALPMTQQQRGFSRGGAQRRETACPAPGGSFYSSSTESLEEERCNSQRLPFLGPLTPRHPSLHPAKAVTSGAPGLGSAQSTDSTLASANRSRGIVVAFLELQRRLFVSLLL